MDTTAIAPTTLRIGHGYDLHRLESGGKPLRLGGLRVESPNGVIAHSDGDALLHAVTDAVLGALGRPDLGQMAPDTDPKFAGANSADFARRAMRTIRGLGWELVNLDATIVLETPKISPIRDEIRRSLSAILGVGIDTVNVKGKTHEGLDSIGQGRAIEVHAVVLIAFRPGA
jgi:2-C-methyl-D-erythritol 2,4-cyclodiphosphate synthase